MNNKPMLEYLLDAGASTEQLSAPDVRALHVAVTRGSEEEVRTLLQHGAQVDSQTMEKFQKMTALHRVVQDRNLSLAALLIDFGASLDARDTDGRTPLHYTTSMPSRRATIIDPEEITRLLLAAGADPDAVDNNGQKADDYCPLANAAKLIVAQRDRRWAFERHCEVMEQKLAVRRLRQFFASWRHANRPVTISSIITSFIVGEKEIADWLLLEDETGTL